MSLGILRVHARNGTVNGGCLVSPGLVPGARPRDDRWSGLGRGPTRSTRGSGRIHFAGRHGSGRDRARDRRLLNGHDYLPSVVTAPLAVSSFGLEVDFSTASATGPTYRLHGDPTGETRTYTRGGVGQAIRFQTVFLDQLAIRGSLSSSTPASTARRRWWSAPPCRPGSGSAPSGRCRSASRSASAPASTSTRRRKSTCWWPPPSSTPSTRASSTPPRPATSATPSPCCPRSRQPGSLRRRWDWPRAPGT